MKVLLRCTLDMGKEGSLPPRSIVNLDRDEAIRLIRQKLAETFDVSKEVDSLTSDDGEEDESNSPSLEETIENLIKIPGIDKPLAAGLYEEGIYSVGDVANMKSNTILISFQGVGKKTANSIIDAAKALIEG